MAATARRTESSKPVTIVVASISKSSSSNFNPKEEALSSPQPKFGHNGWTFEGCLLIHRLLVTGEEEEVLRRIKEVPSESVQVSRSLSFLTRIMKKPTSPIPLLKNTCCQYSITCTCMADDCYAIGYGCEACDKKLKVKQNFHETPLTQLVCLMLTEHC